MSKKESAEKAVREIRRKTRRRFSAEEKIRIAAMTCAEKIESRSSSR
jgi:ribosomal protein L31E